MKEIWKPIPEWEGIYEVSNLGRIKSLPRTVPHSANGSGFQNVKGSFRKITIASNGYPVVSLSYKGRVKVYYVHVLIMIAFIGPPPKGKEVLHKDGNPLHCVRSNLRYGTHKQNAEDSRDHGTLTIGTKNACAAFNIEQVKEIRYRAARGAPLKFLADEFGVTKGTINRCVKRDTYKEVI